MSVLLVLFAVVLTVLWAKAVRIALRADRGERFKDEVATVARFHKTIDRDLDRLLRRGK